MNESSPLVNCARGGLATDVTLFESPRPRDIAGAADDVFAADPPQERLLLALGNVAATPHIGACTLQVIDGRFAQTIIDSLMTGRSPPDVLTPEALPNAHR